ncbi:MAG: 50S ribosomal protein L4 [Chloroflexota bacterium]
MQVTLHNTQGDTIGQFELRDDIFGIEPNVSVMHQALLRQLANARLGTHKTKNRSEVSGGGRKPWRQKGTGRARQGSTRAPQWRGGGTVFGPQPRSYRQKMPRKMRHLAYRSALSAKARDGQLVLLDDLQMQAPKTRDMMDILQRLEVDSSALVLLPERNENVERSVNNIADVKALRASYLNVRDLLNYDFLVLPMASLQVIERILG